MAEKITFIDLFAGIGGFHLALHRQGAKCVFVSEWDTAARKTYQANFERISPHVFTERPDGKESVTKTHFAGDITQVAGKDIPDFDVLCAGFPCQPFSQAGLKKGFNETRGTLFFDIARIIAEKHPRAFFIENVRGLLNHNGGQTFATIQKVITKDLGYSFFHKVIRASDFGVPQHRPRLFVVGFRDKKIKFEFPKPQELKMTMSDVFGDKAEKKIGYTLRVGGRGSDIKDRRNWDAYMVAGKVKRLSSKEGLKMQGFPEDFIFPVSEIQAMKQLGNSVAVPAIQATAAQIFAALQKAEK